MRMGFLDKVVDVLGFVEKEEYDTASEGRTKTIAAGEQCGIL